MGWVALVKIRENRENASPSFTLINHHPPSYRSLRMMKSRGRAARATRRRYPQPGPTSTVRPAAAPAIGGGPTRTPLPLAGRTQNVRARGKRVYAKLRPLVLRPDWLGGPPPDHSRNTRIKHKKWPAALTG